ncbi:MurR/RpiR family transcriptional regulator [Pectinatus haikarae]|uniref:DNA-binding MurR/RpiR family transcriptional regulator n=1 Tax=Pectinatus haikarae TaxID=349096 RepID=A0ABT9YC47_9FIRM|nr:MurR/RpiR family transcriptional regulator [Pectinatus haikarae]MDQ0204792.1 DNA-binding MurR/RpiR family transcriptional regulator [Pectinatus haikarae]
MSEKKDFNVIDKITSCYSDFFDAEKRVADYIMAHSDTVINMTVAELAEVSASSKATVVRVCKKCGCEGFYHLKIKMAKEMVNHDDVKVSNNIDINNLEQSLQNILANKYEELKQTILNIKVKDLDNIINCIKNANMILFAAQGNTIPIALDGAYKFTELGITSFSSTIWEHQLVIAHRLKKTDVVIAISASGESKNLLSIIDVAAKQKATVVAITNSATSSLASKADYHINTISRERLFFPEFSFALTRLAAMAVIEILFFLLAGSKADSHNYIDVHEQSMADDKI